MKTHQLLSENADSNSFGGGFGISGANKLANNRPHGLADVYATTSDGMTPETISRPRMGPGGPSLGGGFQVCVLEYTRFFLTCMFLSVSSSASFFMFKVMLPVKDGPKQRMKLPKVATDRKGGVVPES